MIASPPALGLTTIMMCLLFGANFFLCLVFQGIKFMSRPADEIVKSEVKVKKLSKPFTGSVECFTNLTSELLMTGGILALTYVCENHWIFEHSKKAYSRDLFLFVLIVFFAYAFYTIKPIQDLSLLGREQTEEWKGWMQFIFLLYHYFNAAEVYNSVRVMITCYVWMTGFGNFSFFYIKRDFGWLRMIQMLWRLNFSCLLLMWTHGNTWILYYICPMHTFYFLMVYATMYVYSSINNTKWGIRFKLFALGVIIYIIWDINGGLFDIVFAWLGTSSVVGAGSGSVWEYYFRTSLDHWSTFFGMIFALNYPLAEQYFHKAKGTPLILASMLMGGAAIWWLLYCYTLDKFAYNLQHSYFAIIPLTAYIFFRNLTPSIRSGVSMSLHDLGKTTLETYLLQHHIWLTSNAKTLLTIVPDHPWINFALASMLFMVVSKELYRLTMSLRGMMLPDDKNIAWVNAITMSAVLAVLYAAAFALHSFTPSLLEIVIASIGLALVALLLITRSSKLIEANRGGAFNRAGMLLAAALAGVLLMQLLSDAVTPSGVGAGAGTISGAISASTSAKNAVSEECLAAISKGSWQETRCDEGKAPQLTAFCQTAQWVWEPTACPVGRISTPKLRQLFSSKRVLFMGDSEVRNVYTQFVSLLDPPYLHNSSVTAKHSDLHYAAQGLSVDFIWAPVVSNITAAVRVQHSTYSLVVAGAACWDALLGRSLTSYSADLGTLAETLASLNSTTVWLQPTTIHSSRLISDEKKTHMSEQVIAQHRAAFHLSAAAKAFDTVIDTPRASELRTFEPVDGLHYSEEVYEVVAQMVANGYVLHLPPQSEKNKKYTPRTTGSMSYPGYGAFALALSFVMIFCMDSFLGLGYLSLFLFGRAFDWEAAYGKLHRKIASDSDAESEDKPDRALERVESGKSLAV